MLMTKGPLSIADIVAHQDRHTTSVTRNILRLLDKNMVVKVESDRDQAEGVGRPTKFLYELTPKIAKRLAGAVVADNGDKLGIFDSNGVV